jgi:uncharacterized protein (DUF433 family)
VIRRLRESDWDLEATAAYFDLSMEVIYAIVAYYERYGNLFDARIRLDDAWSLDWERIDADFSTVDDTWIWRHIAFLDGLRVPYEARMDASGARVKTIITQLQLDSWDVERVASSRELSVDAVRAAIVYYERHKDLIDAKILLDNAAFLDWEQA